MTKQQLETAFTALCKCPVEVTIRGDKEFTFSADGNKNLRPIVKYLSESGRVKSSSEHYDKELDFTCLYLELS